MESDLSALVMVIPVSSLFLHSCGVGKQHTNAIKENPTSSFNIIFFT